MAAWSPDLSSRESLPDPHLAEAARALARAFAQARRVLSFTGAGISTECGVPDFRSPGSPWLKHPPMPFQDFMASEANRVEAWRRKFIMDDIYRGAAPGRGHQALATLARQGRMPTLITQNIDGLHQRAGMPATAIIELHGNGSHARCLDCAARHELAPIRATLEATARPPACDACGGILKSATISFGQAMPEAALRRAREEAKACDLFLAVGSSLVVQPAAMLPLIAKQAGAALIIVNADPTPLDDVADAVIRADIGSVLAAALATAS
jgi:NAD-dependent deacetylase